MRSFALLILLAVVGAGLITFTSHPRSVDAQLLHIQLEHKVPEIAPEIVKEPLAIQALLIAYASDPVLVTKAQLALMRHGDQARLVLLSQGDNATFQQVLRHYGEDVVLPIAYFHQNEVLTVSLMHRLSEATQQAITALGWGQGTESVLQEGQQNKVLEHSTGSGVAQGEQPGHSATHEGSLTGLESDQRAAYAVYFLSTEGYNFLAQFTQGPDGKVEWIQTQRVLDGINSFFAGGIRDLETRYKRQEPIELTTVGSAVLDVAIGVSAFKLLRVGRAAPALAETDALTTAAQRSAVMGAGLWRGSAMAEGLVKWGAPAVVVYMAVRHPSVLNAMMGSVAQTLGVPEYWVQLAGWTLILSLIFWLLRFILTPLAWFFGVCGRLLQGADRLLRPQK